MSRQPRGSLQFSNFTPNLNYFHIGSDPPAYPLIWIKLFGDPVMLIHATMSAQTRVWYMYELFNERTLALSQKHLSVNLSLLLLHSLQKLLAVGDWWQLLQWLNSGVVTGHTVETNDHEVWLPGFHFLEKCHLHCTRKLHCVTVHMTFSRKEQQMFWMHFSVYQNENTWTDLWITIFLFLCWQQSRARHRRSQAWPALSTVDGAVLSIIAYTIAQVYTVPQSIAEDRQCLPISFRTDHDDVP